MSDSGISFMPHTMICVKERALDLTINHRHDYVTGAGFQLELLGQLDGPKKDEVTGEWRRLHNWELHILYSTPNIILVIKSRRMKWAGRVARMGNRTGAYRVWVRKPKERRPLGRPRRRWEDSITIDLREVGWERGLVGGPEIFFFSQWPETALGGPVHVNCFELEMTNW